MIGAWLFAMALCLAEDDGPDPADLIRKLGSGEFRERVEAARALDALGRAAIPALRASKDSPDPRVRVRVAPILETLERRFEIEGLTEPTLIPLDFRDRPISEVIDELNRRHDLGLALQIGPLPDRRMMFGRDDAPDRLAEFGRRRITLESPRPLPFWEAIDKLCDATGTRHDLAPQVGFGLSAGRFLLYAGLGRSAIGSDSGAFRVLVTGLHSTFERDFLKAEGSVDRPLNVRMTVVAQPGRVVRQLGPIQVDEAIDDHDRSLVPPGKVEESATNPPLYRNQAPTLNGSTGFDIAATLRLVDPSARSIRRFRGSIPVAIVAYGRNPVVIPLKGAVGKTVRGDFVSVSVVEVVTDPNGSTTVEVGVVSNDPLDHVFRNRNQTWPPDFATFSPDQIIYRLEMFDAEGRKLPLTYSYGRGNNQFEMISRVRLTPTAVTANRPIGPFSGPTRPPPPMPVPVELRYHDLVQVATEIRFDFRDVPLP